MRCGRSNRYLVNLLRSAIDERFHLSGKIIHGFVVKSGLYNDTYLCNRLLDLYCECGDGVYARKVFDEMPVRDLYSWNAYLTFSSKYGDLEEACKVFDVMPERDVVSWNNMISVSSRNGFEEKALVVYERMVSEGFSPSRFTLASVLSACGKVSDGVFGMRCHGVAVKTGHDKNIFVGNGLLSMYGKCGLMVDHGVRVFESLPQPNEVSYTAVIKGLGRENKVSEAVRMFRSMREKGIKVDSVCLSNILSISASPREIAKQIHGLALRLGLLRDLHLNNSLLERYAKSEDMSSAEAIFTEMSEVNVVSWNIMIDGFGRSDKSLEYLKKMRDFGFEPNEITYINVIGACFRSGDVESGVRVFDSMSHTSVGPWNAMLSGYCKYERYEEAINRFRQMQFQNLRPDRTTLSLVLSSCAKLRFLEGGKQIHGVAIRTNVSKNSHIVSGLIAMYSNCEKMEISERIFEDCLTDSDIACWNSMMAGVTDTLSLFKRMQRMGTVLPNETTFAILIGSSSRLCSLLLGRQFHGQVVKSGYVADSFIEAALTDMYCKCGEIDSGREVFDLVLSKTTVIWNEMIHGYACNGRGEEAVDLYREMVSSGEKPDGVTFVSVLTACSHSGLVETGLEILRSMQKDHGVEPELDHYVCVVDCLGRAGRLEEAERLAEAATQYKESFVLWEILLSSCRVHGNVSLARRVAEKLMTLDPTNSAAYVLLSNTYSYVRDWDESEALQGLMNQNRVLKYPGYSWITSDTRNSIKD